MRRLAAVVGLALAVLALGSEAWAHDCTFGHATPDVPALPGDCVDGVGTVLIQAPSLGDPGLSSIVQRCIGLGGRLRPGTPAADGTCNAPPAPEPGDGIVSPVAGDEPGDVLSRVQDIAMEWAPTVLLLFFAIATFGFSLVLLAIGVTRGLAYLVGLVAGRESPPGLSVGDPGDVIDRINAQGYDAKVRRARTEIDAERRLAGSGPLDEGTAWREAEALVARRRKSGWYGDTKPPPRRTSRSAQARRTREVGYWDD